jgi:hypothetical protein
MTAWIRLETTDRVPFAAGMAFGATGGYERITGRAHFRADPAAPAWQGITDLALAPRDADGLVVYTSEFCILKPVGSGLGRRRILFDVINRGDKRALQFFNDAEGSNAPLDAAHAGNGFLMREGYTVAWLAWQGDILPGDGRMSLALPVPGMAADPVTGPYRAEFIADGPGVVAFPLSGNGFTHIHPPLSLDTASARFTRRARESDAREPIDPGAWHFARKGPDGTIEPCATGEASAATHCLLPAGFRAGWIHELVFTARDPLVQGLGFTAVRDFLAFLRYGVVDDAGQANPVRSNEAGIERVYGWGRSQSGRFLREFVYRGWNADSAGRRVFDGIFPHVAGCGRVSLNTRFAQPGRYPRAHEDHCYPSDQFPFAYGLTTDPFSGIADAILKRPDTDPLVIHSQTSSEYWQRRGSLVHTDAFGEDLPEHPRARVFCFSGSQHRAYPAGVPEAGPHRHPSNPLDTAPVLRALLAALDRWATDGTPPPASCVPRRADGTLVHPAAVKAAFPVIPGVTCPGQGNRLFPLDFGPDAAAGIVRREPPAEMRSREYAVLVPAVGADGNEVAGVRTPFLQVPLATHTGWNWRSAQSSDGAECHALCSIIGSWLPFARTAAERAATGDPRPSIEERYASAWGYGARIARAGYDLVDARLMLEEDVGRFVERAVAALR